MGGEAHHTQQQCSCMLVLTAHNVVEAQAMPLDRHIHHVLKRELCWFSGASFNSAGLTLEAILLLPATSFLPGSRTHTLTHVHCIVLHALHSQNRLGISLPSFRWLLCHPRTLSCNRAVLEAQWNLHTIISRTMRRFLEFGVE